MRLLLLLILLFSHAPDPGLAARWETKEHAIVSWTQQARGCLYREGGGERVWVGCYDEGGVQCVKVAGAAIGDIYMLQTSGHTYHARLVWVWYIASMKNDRL